MDPVNAKFWDLAWDMRQYWTGVSVWAGRFCLLAEAYCLNQIYRHLLCLPPAVTPVNWCCKVPPCVGFLPHRLFMTCMAWWSHWWLLALLPWPFKPLLLLDILLLNTIRAGSCLIHSLTGTIWNSWNIVGGPSPWSFGASSITNSGGGSKVLATTRCQWHWIDELYTLEHV